MFTATAKTVAVRRAAHLMGAGSLSSRLAGLAIRPIAARSFSARPSSPLLAAARGSTSTTKASSSSPAKSTATKKATRTAAGSAKKTTKKKAAAKPKAAPKKKKKPVDPEVAALATDRARIRTLKEAALWNQDPPSSRGGAWAEFVREQSGNQKLEGGKGSFTERIHDLQAQWKGLSEHEMERLKAQTISANEQKDKVRKEWIESLPAEKIHLANHARGLLLRKHNIRSTKLHDDRLAKRPQSAYLRFLMSWREGKGTEDMTGQVREASAQWRALSDAEKAPYLAEAHGAMEQYRKDNAATREAITELIKQLNLDLRKARVSASGTAPSST